MSFTPLYRYRAAIARRILLEPVSDPDLLERITVHAANATHARLAIQHVTGAAHVFEAERLSDQPILSRPLPDGARELAGAGIDPDLARRLHNWRHIDAANDQPLSLARLAGGSGLGIAVFA